MENANFDMESDRYLQIGKQIWRQRVGKFTDNVIAWILSVEAEVIWMLLSIFESLVEVRCQETNEQGLSLEKVIGQG